jgi:TolB-like protein/tetratricopeptide (TPR) repeat protein
MWLCRSSREDAAIDVRCGGDPKSIKLQVRGPIPPHDGSFSHRTIPGLATVTERSRVVFLSYASQDAAAALRIADALRTAGIEVWLDQSELRGGDAWDRQIRALIRECRLFVPVISANTEARDEGYFRREWRLAADRTHDMSERKAFLVPVVIDDTSQPGASVPDKFRDVQWTYLPGGERSPEFIARITRLLSRESGENGPPSPRASLAATPHHSVRQDAVGPEPVAAQRQRSSSPAQEREPPRSVAVLPFANLSSDREQEYFSDGLTEELINHLAHVRGLRVLARTSSFAFKGKNEDLRVIGQKLGVGCIVEGSVRKAGNRLRITAQLVECADGYHLWSETFDRDLGDVFAIQNDISKSVASALGVALGFSDDATTGSTRNLEAYDLYLRGRALYRLIAPLEIKRAGDLFRQALALDPEFALAWVALSATSVLIATYIPETAAQVEREWGHAVERALHLAPALPAAHAANVGYQMMRRHWLEADESLRKAKALVSSTSEPVTFCAMLAAVGRVNEALSEGRIVRAADPLNLIASSVLQIVLTSAGEFDEADKEYIRSRDLAGDRTAAEHIALIRAWARKLPSSDLRAFLQRYLDHASVALPVERELLELLDRPDSARDRLRLAFEDSAYQDPTRQFKIATWAAQFGDVDLALGAARRAFMDMRSWSVYIIWLPTYREVRKNPRFKELLRDLGIVNYWRTSGNWGEFARPIGRDDFEVW